MKEIHYSGDHACGWHIACCISFVIMRAKNLVLIQGGEVATSEKDR
jgi:hypothetical protein